MEQTIISFQLTRDEKEVLENIFYLEPWLQGSIDYRRRKGDKFQVKLTGEDVKDLMDALLFQAENEPNNSAKFVSLMQKVHRFWQLKDMINLNKRF